ncbi:hypothetical protein DEJ47_11885 [Streptomyces venezuelae]|uniref:DUF397 domain-containing protein n=1 Tax=Streptomyces venezuelae TaxID=54571 RepID=A0A5P2BAY2_STRVZ|nr:hypothetical protein DEJ47_11885 [Streptomyces venezuelae]
MTHRYPGRGATSLCTSRAGPAGLPHPGWRRSVVSTWGWRKSSASGAHDDDCVEIAWTGSTVLIRDSTRPRGAVVAVGPDTWAAFLSAVARGPVPTRDVTAARP